MWSELFHIFSHWFKLTIILGFIIKSKHTMVLLAHITYSELPIYSKTKLIFFSTQHIRKNWLKLQNIMRKLNIFLSQSMYSILEAIYWTLWSSAYHTHIYSVGPTFKSWPRDWLPDRFSRSLSLLSQKMPWQYLKLGDQCFHPHPFILF